MDELLKADADAYSKALKQMKSEVIWHEYPNKKPQAMSGVLVCYDDGQVLPNYYVNDETEFLMNNCRKVVYWAEMPKPPKFKPQTKKEK